jgi:hypothetical protein
MERRSTSDRFVHYGGDLTAHVESSHGVRLSGGSTGGIVEAVGDDTNVSLRIRSQGAGGISIGANSSQAVTFSGSTRGFKGFFVAVSTYSHGAIGVHRSTEIEIASTTADVDPGDFVAVTSFEPAAESSQVVFAGIRLSTTATSRVTIILANNMSTASATGSGTIRLAWADLT